MRRFIYGIRIFLRDVTKNPSGLIFPLLVLSLSVFVLYWFVFLREGLSRGIETISKGLYARVFLTEGASLEKIVNKLKTSIQIQKWEFIPAERAFKEFSHLYPDLAQILGEENPFSPNLLIYFSPKENPERIKKILDSLKATAGVEDVVFQWEAVEKLQDAKRRLEEIGGFLTLLLVLASALIVANLVAVGVTSHKGEIALMELLGASPSFSSLPFVAMGSLLSLAGAITGLILFHLSLYFLLPRFPRFFQPLPFRLIWLLPAGSLLVGFFSSILAIKRN